MLTKVSHLLDKRQTTLIIIIVVADHHHYHQSRFCRTGVKISAHDTVIAWHGHSTKINVECFHIQHGTGMTTCSQYRKFFIVVWKLLYVIIDLKNVNHLITLILRVVSHMEQQSCLYLPPWVHHLSQGNVMWSEMVSLHMKVMRHIIYLCGFFFLVTQ